MQSIIKGILFAVLLGFFTVVVAQETPGGEELLSPVIEAWAVITLAVLIVAWIIWGIHKIPPQWKNTISFILSIIGFFVGLDYVEETVEKTVRETTVIDTLQIKGIEKVILDSMQEREVRLMRSMDAREARLDGKIETLQNGINVLQDSVHDDRHFRIIRARLDSLRDLYKATKE